MKLHYEMGITRADFLRLLPAAVGHAPLRIEGDEIHGDGAPSWRIKLREIGRASCRERVCELV